MLRLFLSMALLIAIGVGLPSCGNRPRTSQQQVMFYDVRQAIVSTNGNVPLAVASGVQRRLDSAVRMTIRPVSMPRVIMTVRINAIRKGMGIQKGRSEADMTVTLASVDDGAPFQEAHLKVYSFTLEPDAADEAMAEAIAGRIRYSYSLSVPPIRQPVYRQPKISTQLSVDRPLPGPQVIPARQVRKIGANADPVLNSKTVLDPGQPAGMESIKTPEKPAPVEKTFEDGASGKVVIKPAATTDGNGDSGEPCVETLDNKCPAN